MITNLNRAKKILASGHYTCILCHNEIIYTSLKSGIMPVMELINNEIDITDFSVADKVIGKAAALLFAYKNVREIHAFTLSKTAIPILEKYGISYTYDTLIETIKNRSKTDLCPMEKAVSNISSSNEALEKIRETIELLKINAKSGIPSSSSN